MSDNQFSPEQNQDAHDDTAFRLVIDVSNAAAPADELNVSVLWDDGQ